MRLRHGAIRSGLAIVVILGMAGCAQPVVESDPTPSVTTPTPTPTPTPARPALADLVLTPEGLGNLAIGEAPVEDPATAMVTFDPVRCVAPEYGIEAGDPRAGGWAPDASYAESTLWGESAFQVFVDGTLQRLEVYGSTIPTSGGLHIGDPSSAVLAAHPEAQLVLSNYISELYVVHGTAGDLSIEVTIVPPDMPTYWGEQADTVLGMRVTPTGTEPFAVAGGENVIRGCSYTP